MSNKLVNFNILIQLLHHSTKHLDEGALFQIN
jgi:hypothetical protein